MLRTILTFALFCSFAICVSDLRGEIIFLNRFEDSNVDPEVGAWTFGAGTNTSLVGNTSGTHPTLGDFVGLIDRASDVGPTLDLSLDFTRTVSLSGGERLLVDFDFAARRTNGNPKTIFVDALDSSNNIVTRLVLGDTNAFGNGTGDRQRPGYDPSSTGDDNTGNSLFPSGPAAFWWGADSVDANGFDTGRAAHISLAISASSFDFMSTSQTGTSFSALNIANYNGGTFGDITELRLRSAGGNYGFYIDNLVLQAVPEPNSLTLCIAGMGLLGLGRRRRR